MRSNAVFVAMLGALSLVSCQKGEDHKPTAQASVKVETAVAALTEMATSRTYSGTLQESSGTVLSFPVSGTLLTLSVNEGDRVKRGQLVATLDQSTLRNTYDIAKATLEQAQDAYDRMKMLHDSNSLPEMQWVEVQNTLKQAQSAEAIAAKALGDAILHTPVSGYVSEKFMEPGMTVAPVAPVVKIVDIDPVRVNISLPENEIAGIQIGQSAVITVAAADGATFTGKVTEKGVTADPLTRSYNVKITVANPAGTLLPGMICDVVLDNSNPAQAMVLPPAAVLLDANNRNFVWIKHSGMAEKHIVGVEGMSDDGIIISSGIEPGDSVIVSGQQKVSTGTHVVSI